MRVFSILWILGSSCVGTDEDDAGDTPADTDVAADTDTEADATVSCEAYCSLMEEHCPDEAEFHASSCLSICGGHGDVLLFGSGTLGEQNTNSLACRVEHAGLAATTTGAEQIAHCEAAASSGGDTCGSWCDVYCDGAMLACGSTNADWPLGTPDLFPDRAACEASCGEFPTAVLQETGQTDQHFGYGDTVQCRLHHLGAVIVDGVGGDGGAASLHCGHAQPESKGLCVADQEPNAINYCEFAVAFCPELFASDTEAASCRTLVEDLVGTFYSEAGFDSFTDTSDPTLGCLNHWIMQTPHDADLCAKADWDPAHWEINGGEGVCHP